MSEGILKHVKVSHVVVAALFLLVGVDLGVRVGSRGAAPVATASPAAINPARAAGDSTNPAPRAADQQAAEQADGTQPIPSGQLILPPAPPVEPAAAELERNALEANRTGDKRRAADLYREAERATEIPAHKEEFKIRRLWALYELGDLAEVRKIAEDIKAHPARGDGSVRSANKILAKLDAKGK